MVTAYMKKLNEGQYLVQFVMPASATSEDVTFVQPFKNGTIPMIMCTPSYQTSFWVSNITNKGFIYNVGASSAYPQDVNCLIVEKL